MPIILNIFSLKNIVKKACSCGSDSKLKKTRMESNEMMNLGKFGFSLQM
jgi:hypothetical protein